GRRARCRPSLHDDARRAEAGLQHDHVRDARFVPGRPAYAGGIPPAGARRAMMQVTFLGTSAAVPTVDRNVSALMVQREGELLLFDCGEGTQRQMMRYGAGFAVEDVFITHYHADHTLGVPGLLRTMGLQGRTAPVRLHGPRGGQRHLGALVALGMERPKFPVEIVELRAGGVLSRGEYDIVVGEAMHKGDCLAYAIVECDRLGRFD